MMQREDIFENCKDLNALTNKTADEHIAFYKNKENLTENELFGIWKRLSRQAENFDKMDWTENWHNWSKNMPAFIGNKYEAKFLIQNYLTDVLEELVTRLVRDFKDATKLVQKTEQRSDYANNLSGLIKQEIKRQVKLELSRLGKNKDKDRLY